MEFIGKLNTVNSYLTLDDRNAMACPSDELNMSEGHLLETRCCVTVKTLMTLFNSEYEKEIDDISDHCTVSLSTDKISDPSHVFLYAEGFMYHSYAMEFTAQRDAISKEIISERLKDFIRDPDVDKWELITGVKEQNIKGKYSLKLMNITKCDTDKLTQNALLISENALEALLNSDDERYHYDDYTYILSLGYSGNLIENAKAFLNKLICDIRAIF